MSEYISLIDAAVWGTPMIILILSVGIILTFKSSLVQVRRLGLSLKYMFKNEEGASGDISSFESLCTALSATIGTGNIVGVASALSLGGPGALFWMLVSAFIGMASKYAEGLLAVKFRIKSADGSYLGGPFYYIERGLGKKWRPLSVAFAFFGASAGLLGIGTITQINGITSAAEGFYDPEKNKIFFSVFGNDYTYATVITGAIVTILSALVLLGGIKRIAKFSGIVVPFMAVMYVSLTLIIIINRRKYLPEAIDLIIKSAFSASAVSGSISGITLKSVISLGVGRGIFSNEAGLGSAPIAAAAAKTDEPVRQGLVSMTATLIDTVIICTLTGLSIVLTGAWDPGVTGNTLEGVSITSFAWQTGLPFGSRTSSVVLMLCLAFFAFTTIVGWNYYGEKCIQYLNGGKSNLTFTYRLLYIAAVFIGPYLTINEVWSIAGIFNGLMAFPNLVALVCLSGVVKRETDEYFAKHKS